MKILVLGGDGFCGWPTSLHLSARQHEVVIVDNLSRRKIDLELEAFSLTPIRPIHERLQAWEQLTGEKIAFHCRDIAKDFDWLVDFIADWRPDAIVHFAEQRAAPYSMKSANHRRYTVNNNINATNNVLAACVEAGVDAHIVHLGTMGVYGYGSAGAAIPEGYLRVQFADDAGGTISREILHPTDPGSIYHMTKAQDQLLFAFYNKNDGLRVTDLHQGIVWGTQTAETAMDERLINRFDYDGDYGTVLNRFAMQAAIGNPIQVHGSGGQTRAFINIQDTVQCIRLAVENPPRHGERVRIFNQMTETHRIIDLARLVAKLTGAEIAHVDNPRKEAAENELDVASQGLLDLGLKPITLAASLLSEVVQLATDYAENCDRSKIPCVSRWSSAPIERAARDVLKSATGRQTAVPRGAPVHELEKIAM
jgi:UDP-sulfoquinovose synthase